MPEMEDRRRLSDSEDAFRYMAESTREWLADNQRMEALGVDPARVIKGELASTDVTERMVEHHRAGRLAITHTGAQVPGVTC